MYVLIVYLESFGEWRHQYGIYSSGDANSIYKQKEENDKAYRGSYVFEVAEIGTDLKTLPKPNYSYGVI